MLDHDNGDAARAEAADHRHDITDFGRVEPSQHLIEQQKLRFDRQRAGELEPLTPGDGKCIGEAVEHFGDTDLAGDLLSNGERGRARAVMQVRADEDVLAYREAGERLHDLEVRAMPRRARRCGGSPVTSSPE